MKEQLQTLQKEMNELTKTLKSRQDAGQAAEVKELSDKLKELSSQMAERKMQFEAAQASPQLKDQKELARKRDEVFIAKALCVNKDGSFNQAAFDKVLSKDEYKWATKADSFTFDPTVPDGQVSGGDTSASGYGSDMVPEGFSAQLVEDIYLKLEVAGLFKRFNMPSPTYTFPVALNRITARAGSEGKAVTKDKVATDSLTFTAKKLMANVDFTDELDVDSAIAILPFLRERLIEGFALAQEQIAVNGDTVTTADAAAGLNGTIDADDARGIIDGLRKAAMSVSGDVDFAGAFTADEIRSLRAKMGRYGKNPRDLSIIVNIEEYNKILGFTGYQYLYQYGDNAVIKTGEMGRIDNIPIIVTDLLPKNLTANGYPTTTPGTKTCCMMVNNNSFMWGDRVGFALEMFRNPYIQATSLVGSQRLDFKNVAESFSTAVPVAMGINF